MTRDQIKNKIMNIIEDIEPYVHDDSGLYIPSEEIERVAEAIMKLWDQGVVYDLPKKHRCGCRLDCECQ